MSQACLITCVFPISTVKCQVSTLGLPGSDKPNQCTRSRSDFTITTNKSKISKKVTALPQVTAVMDYNVVFVDGDMLYTYGK